MKRIVLKKIYLNNYKCFQNREIDFSQKTIISGRNRMGKSTIENAYLETVTGKEVDGSAPDSVRPHDANGNDLNRADVVREVHLLIDGSPVVIRKRTYQKWRKPRGQAEEVFCGNGEDYEVDGFPYKPEKFKEYMAGIAEPDVLLMCSNANPFLATLQKSTAEARKILEKMAGFRLEDFIRDNPEYREVADLTKGHSVEDAFKKLRKDLSAQKKKIEAQNEKIKHEQSRPLVSGDIELADLELIKGEWKEKLAEIEEQEKLLAESVKAYDELVDEIRKLKAEKASLEAKASDEQLNKRLAVREKISGKKTEMGDAKVSLASCRSVLEEQKNQIDRLEALIAKTREEYASVAKQEYDESRLRALMEKTVDETSLICPTCGQTFPEKKRIEILESLESEKKSEEKRRDDFYLWQDEHLNELTEKGNKAVAELKSMNLKFKESAKRIPEIESKIQEIGAEIEALNAELAGIPETVDVPETEDLNKRISEKEKQLATLDSGSNQEWELRHKWSDYTAEIANIDSQIQAAIREKENRENILLDLQKELREMAQVQAYIERDIDTLSEFSRAKNAALAESINPHFRHFQFEFLEYTIEGNPVETCKLVCNGTSYFDGLNGGDRKLVEADLCRGFQEMNGLSCPIWIDESNTIDPERIPADLEQQLILILRSDGDLKIENGGQEK